MTLNCRRLFLLLIVTWHLVQPFEFRFQIPWWRLTTRVLSIMDRYESFRKTVPPLDFSAGAGQISVPREDDSLIWKMNDPLFNEALSASNVTYERKPQLLLAHQMGKRIAKKLPDGALLGVIVIIASELLQRENEQNFIRLPPQIRTYVNATANELDQKLEFLSSMQWNADSFLRTEIENMQKQPLEVVNKFLVAEILPKVDKELSPLLSSLVGDPKTATLITGNIKSLIKVSSMVLLNSTSIDGYTSIGNLTAVNPIAETTNKILDQVDYIGELAENAIADWNSILQDINSLSKQDTLLSSTTATSISSTTDSIMSILNMISNPLLSISINNTHNNNDLKMKTLPQGKKTYAPSKSIRILRGEGLPRIYTKNRHNSASRTTISSKEVVERDDDSVDMGQVNGGWDRPIALAKDRKEARLRRARESDIMK
jgi:hypothetical protein